MSTGSAKKNPATLTQFGVELANSKPNVPPDPCLVRKILDLIKYVTSSVAWTLMQKTLRRRKYIRLP